MTKKKITLDEVRTAVLAQCDAHPYKKNPYQPGTKTCTYTDARNPSRHCMVGQLLVDIGGLPVPGPDVFLSWNDIGLDDVSWIDRAEQPMARRLAGAFTREAHEFLNDVQLLADGVGQPASPRGDTRRTWGKVARMIREKVDV